MAKLSHYSILVVEDEESVAGILISYLKLYEGFDNIVHAKDGIEATQKLSNQDFDLIFTDIVMERKDGLKFVESLRKIPKYYNQEIIIVSGCMTSELTLECMRRGIRNIIVKPFTIKQILYKAFTSLKIDGAKKTVAKIVERKTLEMLEMEDEDFESEEEKLEQEVEDLIKKSFSK